MLHLERPVGTYLLIMTQSTSMPRPLPEISQSPLPGPEAPEECQPSTNPLDRCCGQSRVKKNGIGSRPDGLQVNQERNVMQSELGKCIRDFQKIKIPRFFPNEMRPWQSELLRKYQV